jgi:8-oxo-dGTP pyrophosphatase MutT (NUDIX family)
VPFSHITARAVILRRRDGALLAALHRPDGSYAPPGGTLKDGEDPEKTITRELDEEGIKLVNPDQNWTSRLIVDYFPGYSELSLWYLFLVDDADFKEIDEILDVQWFSQDEDPWYPYQREKVLLFVRQYLPEYLQK